MTVLLLVLVATSVAHSQPQLSRQYLPPTNDILPPPLTAPGLQENEKPAESNFQYGGYANTEGSPNDSFGSPYNGNTIISDDKNVNKNSVPFSFDNSGQESPKEQPSSLYDAPTKNTFGGQTSFSHHTFPMNVNRRPIFPENVGQGAEPTKFDAQNSASYPSSDLPGINKFGSQYKPQIVSTQNEINKVTPSDSTLGQSLGSHPAPIYGTPGQTLNGPPFASSFDSMKPNVNRYCNHHGQNGFTLSPSHSYGTHKVNHGSPSDLISSSNINDYGNRPTSSFVAMGGITSDNSSSFSNGYPDKNVIGGQSYSPHGVTEQSPNNNNIPPFNFGTPDKNVIGGQSYSPHGVTEQSPNNNNIPPFNFGTPDLNSIKTPFIPSPQYIPNKVGFSERPSSPPSFGTPPEEGSSTHPSSLFNTPHQNKPGYWPVTSNLPGQNGNAFGTSPYGFNNNRVGSSVEGSDRDLPNTAYLPPNNNLPEKDQPTLQYEQPQGSSSTEFSNDNRQEGYNNNYPSQRPIESNSNPITDNGSYIESFFSNTSDPITDNGSYLESLFSSTSDRSQPFPNVNSNVTPNIASGGSGSQPEPNLNTGYTNHGSFYGSRKPETGGYYGMAPGAETGGILQSSGTGAWNKGYQSSGQGTNNGGFKNNESVEGNRGYSSNKFETGKGGYQYDTENGRYPVREHGTENGGYQSGLTGIGYGPNQSSRPGAENGSQMQTLNGVNTINSGSEDRGYQNGGTGIGSSQFPNSRPGSESFGYQRNKEGIGNMQYMNGNPGVGNSGQSFNSGYHLSSNGLPKDDLSSDKFDGSSGFSKLGNHLGNADLGKGVNSHYGPTKYQFDYEVNDAHSGTEFGHKENSDGDVAQGSYNVLLPDGRKQIVDYQADKMGFRPMIRYEAGQGVPGKQGEQLGYPVNERKNEQYSSSSSDEYSLSSNNDNRFGGFPSPGSNTRSDLVNSKYTSPVNSLGSRSSDDKGRYQPGNIGRFQPVVSGFKSAVSNFNGIDDSFSGPVSLGSYSQGY